jgi:hypothetical protein
LEKKITRFVSPGQLVGTESLSSSSSSFVDHCTCIAPAIAISFAASDYKSILKFSRQGRMSLFVSLLQKQPFLPPDVAALEALVLEMNVRTCVIFSAISVTAGFAC